ncbi:MAG: hypothetical protein HY426_02850 [Candidatus Levybacteria bacterium]|nr:hypothetical protein [Candidatus Levybacteria bacterium]
MFLTHGDDDGLVLPPKIAPIKMVILPIFGKYDQKVLNFSKKIKEEVEKGLKGTEYEGRVEIWNNPEKTLGWKLSEAELKGIPIEATVGLKEVEENGVVLATRLTLDTEDGGIKHRQVRLDEIGKNVLELLESLQRHLYKIASRYLEENTHEVTTYEEFKEIMNMKRGFIKAFWCEDAECEKEIKDETKASTRILPLDAKQEIGACVHCGKKAKGRWLFGQAY